MTENIISWCKLSLSYMSASSRLKEMFSPMILFQNIILYNVIVLYRV